MSMEIKTTNEIYGKALDDLQHNSTTYMNILKDKKWVAVDDEIKFLDALLSTKLSKETYDIILNHIKKLKGDAE